MFNLELGFNVSELWFSVTAVEKYEHLCIPACMCTCTYIIHMYTHMHTHVHICFLLRQRWYWYEWWCGEWEWHFVFCFLLFKQTCVFVYLIHHFASTFSNWFQMYCLIILVLQRNFWCRVSVFNAGRGSMYVYVMGVNEYKGLCGSVTRLPLSVWVYLTCLSLPFTWKL